MIMKFVKVVKSAENIADPLTRLLESKEEPIKVSRNLFYEREPVISDDVLRIAFMDVTIKAARDKLPDVWKELMDVTDDQF